MSEKSERKRKPKGMRPDNRIQVTYTDGRRPDGSPNRIPFYGRTRIEANAKREEYKRQRGIGINPTNILLSEWIETYKGVYRKKVNPAYIVNDDVPYNRLSQALGHMRVKDVRESHLQTELNRLEGMSYSTVNTYAQVMNRVFGRARKNKIIPDNPAEDLTLPWYTEGSHRALERWEADCILSNWQFHRSGLWAMLMLLCGLRRGELMALDWDAVDMVGRTLEVHQVAVIRSNQAKIENRAKSPAGVRTLPICQPLWDALNQVPEAARKGPVCLSANRKPLSATAFKRGWDGFNLAMQRILNGEDLDQRGRRKSLEKRIEEAKEEGREYIIFNAEAHDLRHTFATALYDAGIPVKAAQYYLGHVDIRTTMDLYTHLSKEKERASRIQLTTFLDGWLKPGIIPIEQNPD